MLRDFFAAIFASTKDNRVLNWLGDLTYSLYLTHAALIWLPKLPFAQTDLASETRHFVLGLPLSPEQQFAAACLIVVALLARQLLERPAQALTSATILPLARWATALGKLAIALDSRFYVKAEAGSLGVAAPMGTSVVAELPPTSISGPELANHLSGLVMDLDEPDRRPGRIARRVTVRRNFLTTRKPVSPTLLNREIGFAPTPAIGLQRPNEAGHGIAAPCPGTRCARNDTKKRHNCRWCLTPQV